MQTYKGSWPQPCGKTHFFFRFYWRFHGRNKKNQQQQTSRQNKTKTTTKQGVKKIFKTTKLSPSLNLSPKLKRRGKECKQSYAQFEEPRKKSNCTNNFLLTIEACKSCLYIQYALLLIAMGKWLLSELTSTFRKWRNFIYIYFYILFLAIKRLFYFL